MGCSSSQGIENTEQKQNQPESQHQLQYHAQSLKRNVSNDNENQQLVYEKQSRDEMPKSSPSKQQQIQEKKQEIEEVKQEEEKEKAEIENQQIEAKPIEKQIVKEEVNDDPTATANFQIPQTKKQEDQESTATATWVAPQTQNKPKIQKIEEKDGTITENWVQGQKESANQPAYEITSTQYFAKGNQQKQTKIMDEIIFEIQEEEENSQFKTFVSQFGREVFGDDIEDNIEFFLQTTTTLKVLGQGAFGKVVKAYSPVYGVYLAMKYFKDEEKAQEEIMQYQYLLKLNSPMIMKFYMAFKNPEGQVILVLQYGATDLANLIVAHQSYQPGQIYYFLNQVIPGFLQLKRELQIAHRDIKPENFILADTKTEFIICDFGEACVVNDDGQITDLSRYTFICLLQIRWNFALHGSRSLRQLPALLC